MSPYSVEVPNTLKSVSFIEEDLKRFSDTNGWGYAQFSYDAASVRSSLSETTAHPQ
jgi:hypothetical protein